MPMSLTRMSGSRPRAGQRLLGRADGDHPGAVASRGAARACRDRRPRRRRPARARRRARPRRRAARASRRRGTGGVAGRLGGTSGRRTMKVAPWSSALRAAPARCRRAARRAGARSPDRGRARRRSRLRRLGLAEALEHMRQELGRDAGAGVGDAEPTLRARRARARSVTWPPSGVNLIAFDSRFHTICCSRPGSASSTTPACGVDPVAGATPLASAAGCSACTRRLEHRRRATTWLDVELEVARRRCGSRRAGPRSAAPAPARCARSSRPPWRSVDACSRAAAAAGASSRGSRQRRAQLVRQRGEELVLHPAGALGLEPRLALGHEQGLALALEPLLPA